MNESVANGLAVISAEQIEHFLPMADVIPLMRDTMIAVSQGQADLPLRMVMPVSGTSNLFGIMPGHLVDPDILGAKLVAVFPHNPQSGLSSHMGLVVLFDAENGRPRAVLDAAAITAIRTAAASAAATDALANEKAGDLAILGTGEQAMMHLRSMNLVRPLRRIRIWGRRADASSSFATACQAEVGVPIEPCDTVRAATEGADIICTVTGASDPILHAVDVAAGAHVNLVGASVQSSAEASVDLVKTARYFVDFRPSAMAQAGELKRAIDAGAVDADHIRGEIGEVFSAAVSGRTAVEDVTIYKSLGVAAQDLTTAQLAWQRVVAAGACRPIPL